MRRHHRRSWSARPALLLVGLLAMSGCGGSSSSTGPAPGLVPEGDPVSIAVTPTAMAIEPGTNQQFTATATYANTATANVTQSATWSTSNGTIMTISNAAGSRGLATRNTDASVTVTATLGALSSSLQVSVWSEVIASALRFDGDVSGVGTGFAIGHLTADASAVYWAAFDNSLGSNGGSIGRVPKAGGAATTLATGLGGITSFTSDGAHVYWTEFELASGDGAVKRVPVAGGSVEVLASGTPAGSVFNVFFPGGIVVDGSFVYWGESVGGGAIRRVGKAGGTVTDLGRGQGFGPDFLTIDGGYFYGIANNSGTVARMPVGGGTVTVMATGLTNPFDMALDANSVYWAELVGTTGRIMSVPRSGGTPVAVASGLDNPRSVETAGGNVYYAGIVRSGALPVMGVWRAAPGGGTLALAVDAHGTDGGFDPFSIAVDASNIFFVDAAWNSPGASRVLRAPRE